MAGANRNRGIEANGGIMLFVGSQGSKMLYASKKVSKMAGAVGLDHHPN